MDKKKICEALYALPGRVVVRRRRPLTVPALWTILGFALIACNSLGDAWLSDDVRSAAVLVGGLTAAAGAVALIVRLFASDGAPYHRAAKCFLRYEARFYENDARTRVADCVTDGDLEALMALPEARIPVVAVALYRTADNRFAAMQAYEYAELEYRPLTPLHVVARDGGA